MKINKGKLANAEALPNKLTSLISGLKILISGLKIFISGYKISISGQRRVGRWVGRSNGTNVLDQWTC